MVFSKFFKKQLRTVIEWKNQSPDILLAQFPALTDEIKNSSKLIVNPGQGCILVYEGKVIDVLTEQGIYKLETANHPFITNLLKTLQSFESEHKMNIYFFRTAELVNQKWGTSTPIKYVDSAYQFPIELGAYGTYSIRLAQAESFFTNIIGNKTTYTADDLRQLIVARIIPSIASQLAAESYSYQNIDAKLATLSLDIKDNLQVTFDNLGFALTDFRIEATSFNDETIERINKIADSKSDAIAAEQVGMSYVDHEKLKALRDAAKNEGGLAGAGLQLGAGFEFAKSFNLNQAGTNSSAPAAAASMPEKNDEDVSFNQLKKLKSLLDEGILTQDEFDVKKKQILDKM